MEREGLEAKLRSRDPKERLKATSQIVQAYRPDYQPLLLTALKDSSNYTASMAAEALGRLGDETIWPTLIERFASLSENGIKRDSGCHIRSQLAMAFGRREVHSAVEVLRKGVRTVQIEPVS